MANEPVTPNPHRPNGWGFLRDVLIAAMNKGQLIPMLAGLIALLWLGKMPGTQMFELYKDLTSIFKSTTYLGWTITIIITPIFVVLYRKTIKYYKQRIQELTNEKEEMQKEISDLKQKQITSSTRKK